MTIGEDVQSQIHGRVVSIMTDLFQLEEVASTSDIRRDEVAEWDSVSHLHLILEVEEAFGVELADREVVEIASARDITVLLERRGVASPVAPR